MIFVLQISTKNFDFFCSAEISMEYILLINNKMPSIVRSLILTLFQLSGVGIVYNLRPGLIDCLLLSWPGETDQLSIAADLSETDGRT